MNKLTKLGSLGLAGMATAALMAYTIPTAFGDNDRVQAQRGHSRRRHD